MAEVIEDIDFEAHCPYCGHFTPFDNEQFECRECRIAWPPQRQGRSSGTMEGLAVAGAWRA